MASLPSVVNSVCLRRAPCPFLGSPTHYHRHFPDVGDRARNRPADRLRRRENRGIELRRIGSRRSAPPARRSEAVTWCLHTVCLSFLLPSRRLKEEAADSFFGPLALQPGRPRNHWEARHE